MKNRSLLGFGALVALLLLTGATWGVADVLASALAGIAAMKIAIVGLVFLDLDRVWPGWSAVSAVLVGAVLGGAVLLIEG